MSKKLLERFTLHLMQQWGRAYSQMEYIGPEEAHTRMVDEILDLRQRLEEYKR